jgi:hypothetical protein
LSALVDGPANPLLVPSCATVITKPHHYASSSRAASDRDRPVTPASSPGGGSGGAVDGCGGHCVAFENFCYYCLQVRTGAWCLVPACGLFLSVCPFFLCFSISYFIFPFLTSVFFLSYVSFTFLCSLFYPPTLLHLYFFLFPAFLFLFFSPLLVSIFFLFYLFPFPFYFYFFSFFPPVHSWFFSSILPLPLPLPVFFPSISLQFLR